jgi:4-nitrophenyl phosphatase
MILDKFPSLRGVILDMDGVLWRDNEPIGNLPYVFDRMKSLGLGITLATNNATKTTAEYIDKLKGFGVHLDPWQIVNSSEAAGYLLKEKFPQGGSLYVVGETSLKQVLSGYGFVVTDRADADIVAVIAGMDRTLTFNKLKIATLYIRNGALFVGTNPDRTFPTTEGLIPGAGAILAAIETATDIKPIIAGKPASPMFELALQRLTTSPEYVLCVGDRLETDIAGGQSAGCKTALVLSGVTSREAANNWQPSPDIISKDLTTLFA